MKKYVVNNYKGNIVESIKSFQNNYPGFKVVEACERNGKLKICVIETIDSHFTDATAVKDFVKRNSDKKFGQKFVVFVESLNDELLDHVCKYIDGNTLLDLVYYSGYSPTKKEISIVDFLYALYVYTTGSNDNRKKLVEELLNEFIKKGWTTISGTATGERRRFYLKKINRRN